VNDCSPSAYWGKNTKGLKLEELQRASRRCPIGLIRLVRWMGKTPAGTIADVVYQVWDGKR